MSARLGRLMGAALSILAIGAAGIAQPPRKGRDPGDPPVKVEQLARDSGALRRYLKEKPEARDRLLADPKVKEQIERDPALRSRVARDGKAALEDDEVLGRILGKREAVLRALEDKGAQEAVQGELAGFQAKVTAGQAAAVRGLHREAVGNYELAVSEARRLENRQAEAAALIENARALESWDRDEKATARAESAIRLYDAALSAGDERQQLVARNNKSVALLRLKRPADAVAVLREVAPESVPESERPVLRFNLAKALEADGKDDEALAGYRQVIAERPEFRPASEGVFRVLLRSSSPARVRDAAAEARALIQRGQAELAGSQMKECLRRWSTESDFPLLCEQLLRSYQAGKVGPADYLAREKRELSELSRSRPVMKNFTDALEKAYEGTIAVAAPDGGMRKVFPSWDREEIRQEWSRLLKQSGDAFDDAGNPKEALARYLAAWDVDPRSTEPLVYVAEILRQNPELLEAHRPIMDQVIKRVFADKGDSYRIAYKSKSDWTNLLRYHVLLATIFEQQGAWGDSDTVRSVIFQLERAILAEGHVREIEPSFPPSPGLHFRLAGAYVARPRSGRQDKQVAFEHDLQAGEGFVALGDAKEARRSIDAAAVLLDAADPSQRDRLAALRERVDRMGR